MLRKVSVLVLVLAAVTAGVILLTSCGSSSSRARDSANRIAEQGLYYGLWHGNVDVVPARPSELPARFFESAPPAAKIPVDSQGLPVLMDPAKIKRPLWVFADPVNLRSVADKIKSAMLAERPIVIVGADQSSIEQVFGLCLTTQISSQVPLTDVAWSWLPWMHQKLTEGTIVSRSGVTLTSEQEKARYYQFMVNSTLRPVSPGQTAS